MTRRVMPRARRTALLRRLPTPILLGIAFGAAGCGGAGTDGAPGVITSEAFVGAYVDLRVEAIRAGTEELSEAVRDGILAERNLSPEDLLLFVDTYGTFPDYMSGVWERAGREIRERLADPVPGSSPPPPLDPDSSSGG